MIWRIFLSLTVALPLVVSAETYEIGEKMGTAAFWSSDPVLFVRRHAEAVTSPCSTSVRLGLIVPMIVTMSLACNSPTPSSRSWSHTGCIPSIYGTTANCRK